MRIIREFRDFNRLIVESKEDCPFLFTDSSTDKDFHQAILDVGYSWWQNNEVESYADMVYKMEKEFGYKFALLILLGKYNQQVGNGGHIQYFDNGYASAGSSGFGGNHRDIELHDEMIEWFKKAGLDETNTGKIIYDVMVESGEVFEDMAEGEQRCGECDGSGYVDNYKMYGEVLSRLDDKYYTTDDWEDILNKFSKDIIKEKYPEEWEKFLVRREAGKYGI